MRFCTPILMVATVLLGARGATADETPAEVTRAHSAVVKDATRILKMAYPTARGMTGDASGSYHERLGGGYSLDEKFDYADSDGDRQSFTLRMTVDRNGAFTGISELRRSELWPTFGTGNLLLAAIKAAARNQVDEARQNGREPPPAALLILRADDITEIVVIVLNADR